ncbi:ARM repeat-containing protein [Laetiporus sulphureus 93-53]|uniref:ARM repeat-containing protein n=1 Tax=Laetiporus sulphureus 93-53 TaxID=1314785 RepID=A0A165FYU3_9APHY|nr:ARM repeat-containing protein [Laetiporus sulphureus 93-53]KZT09593.1 ARM repeat-containing protein [Laetiporus sulphureus 93-53]
MTIEAMSLSALKKAKNTIIGNPTAKHAMANDEALIGTLVDFINNPPLILEDPSSSQDDIRIEAAHVIASLSYGSEDALKTLMRYNAHQAFVYAIASFRPPDSPKLRAAFARALRALAASIADAVGPSQWGLHTASSEVRNEAKVALDYLFQVICSILVHTTLFNDMFTPFAPQPEVLDIFLPLLADPSAQTVISIAQLLANAIRVPIHRVAVSDWLPVADRLKEVKGKRGWEKPGLSSSPRRRNGWVMRSLIALLQKKDIKSQEAALSALACLAKDNPPVASELTKAILDGEAPLSQVLAYCTSRCTDLQLAACLCAMQIIRSGFPHRGPWTDDSPALTVMYVVNRSMASESDSAQTRTRACFILGSLVSDNKELCDLAFQRGSLDKLAALIKHITPTEKNPELEEDEPESVSCLREAALTAVAMLSLFNDDIRCAVAGQLGLIPAIQISLSHPHIGIRYAACQCVRAISRSVAVLRTNMIDSGLGMAAYQVFQKQVEDRRITFAASSVVCNLVNECSPLRTMLLEEGLLDRLKQLLNSEEQALRVNALWAMKNLLYHSSLQVKRDVMRAIRWENLPKLLSDPDPAIQEQAFHIVRHIADGQEDVEMVFDELGSDVLLSFLAIAMESDNEDVLHQAVCVLANLANSSPHQNSILSHSRILAALKQCLVDAKVEVRRPAVACVLELAKINPRSHKQLHDAGIDSTLRHLCEYSGAVSGSPTRRYMHAVDLQMSMEDEVREKAREALHWLEHNVEMSV